MANENDPGTRREQRRAKQKAENSDGGAAPADNSAGSAQEIRDRNARLRAKAAADRQNRHTQERARMAATASGLDASERLDDIFVRTTHAVTLWIRQNFKWLQWALILSVIGMFGVQGVRYYQRQVASKSTDILMEGALAESGTVGNDEEGKSIPEELRRWDTRPQFHDDEQRLDAAEKNFKATIERFGKTGAADHARLQLAGIKYDQKAFDEASSLYGQVRASKLALDDIEVKGRAIEGMGFCLEAKADQEGALKSFRELSNIEGSLEFAVLGLYHQARVLLAQGKKDAAKDLLNKAQKRLSDDKESLAANYYKKPIREAMAQVDPTAASSDTTTDLSELLRQDPARLQRMINGFKQKGSGAPPVDEPGEPQ